MTTYDFAVRRGDTYNGATFTVAVNSAPLDLTGAAIKAQFGHAPSLVLSIGAGIAVTNAAGGAFRFDSRIIDLPAGTYPYDIQITLASGVVRTYISGVMTVAADITT